MKPKLTVIEGGEMSGDIAELVLLPGDDLRRIEARFRAEMTRDAFLFGGFEAAWIIRMEQDFLDLHRTRFEDGQTVQDFLRQRCI